jgi:hypothetical protein
LPGAPAARRRLAMLHACPTHIVETGVLSLIYLEIVQKTMTRR